MRSPYSNYFAFTRTQADSSQGLFLGEHIGGGSGASPPLVRIGDKFASVDGQAETYSSLSTSPSNRYLVASTTVIVVGSQPSMDFDNSVYELKSGNFLKMVNEQTVFGALSALDQSTPEAISARNKLSPAYEAWQQGQIAQTTDPAFLAALEHDTFIIPPYPDFMQTVGPVWSDRDNFYLGYKVDLVSLLGFSGSDTFVFEFDVEGHILSHDARHFTFYKRLADAFGLQYVGSDHYITFEGRRVVQERFPLGGYVKADHVAGYSPLAE